MFKTKQLTSVVLASLLTAACASSSTSQPSPTPQPLPKQPENASSVLLYKDITWEQLNPARGNNSPQAGTVWGNRTGEGPAGFILKPKDGFRSPPHIHNTSYRGIVIEDTLHNDDPSAEDMFMPTGSYWTQPAGDVHITAALGTNSLAYIEVEEVFQVQPSSNAFDNAERPVNIDVSNLVWIDQAGKAPIEGVKVNYLWKSQKTPTLSGTLVKLNAGQQAILSGTGSTLRAVIIQGDTTLPQADKPVDIKLTPGSYFGTPANTAQMVKCTSNDECLLYVRIDGAFNVIEA